TLARCRELYNAGLAERKEAYRMAGKSISYYEQQRDLPEIKNVLREEYQQIHSQVLQDVLLRLDRAFKAFFRRVANGEKPGYPPFQGRNRYHSFTYPQGGYTLSEKRVTRSKIGSIKIKLHRPIEGTVKTCTITYEAGQWYAVFSCECEARQLLPVSEEEVGIDLGLLHFAALWDGTFINNPRYSRKTEKTLEKRQQVLSRKKRGSHRREKARRQVAKAHRKIRNQRRDFLHKQAKRLVERYQTIVFEDVQTEHLVKRPKAKQDENGKYLPNGASAKAGLNKSILDAGWAMFVDVCSFKAACAGRNVVKVNPYKTSQICSACLRECPHKELDVRTHVCIHCGVVLDRDTNAARNILRLGRSQRGTTCVEAPCRKAAGTSLNTSIYNEEDRADNGQQDADADEDEEDGAARCAPVGTGTVRAAGLRGSGRW
ncbi:MAG TPA: transposase, partial [Ktedonobacteraceae bacterium]|nr:transposase [Ktedonobacteraceae bacterium]